jgi:hypothetical protein
MSTGIYKLTISEEERLALLILQWEQQGKKFPLENYTHVIEEWYSRRPWPDDRWELKDLGDGCGPHLFRPFEIADYEREFILKRRARLARRLKARNKRAQK